MTGPQPLSVVIASAIDSLLRRPGCAGQVSDLAEAAGYSRSHFGREFARLTGETPRDFAKRVRLEQAAYRLAGARVGAVAELAGYGSSEAFARAFRSVFGKTPREFEPKGDNWRLPSPEDLHWCPERSEDADLVELRLRYPAELVRAPELRLAVTARQGSYAVLDEHWSTVTPLPGKRWATVYYDSIWTCPNSDLMRSHLGFVLRPDESPPPVMEELCVPASLAYRLVDPVPRARRHEAWSYVSGAWPDTAWSLDFYDDFPLPWNENLTRIEVRLPDKRLTSHRN